MYEQSDKIQGVESGDLTDERTIELMDYIVTGGVVYQVVRDDFGGDLILKRVDEIPVEYWDRWTDNKEGEDAGE